MEEQAIVQCLAALAQPLRLRVFRALVVAGLRGMLGEMLGPALMRGQEVSLAETDGTRLVSLGTARRVGNRVAHG